MVEGRVIRRHRPIPQPAKRSFLFTFPGVNAMEERALHGRRPSPETPKGAHGDPYDRTRLARYRRKLREQGLRQIIMGRLQWYKLRVQMDNWFVGKLVELFGNRVKVHGVSISVDNPLVTTHHKSTLFFGIYEVPEFELSRRHLDFSLPTIELGASIGGVACAINKLQENPKAHVVVECNPLLLPTLEKNRELNHSRFTIVPAAVA